MENIEKNNQTELEAKDENINTAQEDTEITEEEAAVSEEAAETAQQETAEEAPETVPEVVVQDIDGDSDGASEYEVEEDSDDEDISKVAERITRIRRSMLNSAGTIRTRSPEQNRSITNGIPVRHSTASSNQVTQEAPSEKNGKLFNIIIICAIALLVLVTAAVVLINVLNANSLMRPADHNITGEVPSDADTTVPTPVTEPTQFKVTLDFYSRKDIELSTAEITLSELLDSIGCRLGENEKPSVPLDTLIKADTVITVDTYEYVTETVDEIIPFEVENTETDLIMRGTRETVAGEDGAKTTEYEIEYVNGVEKSRTVISETVTKEPVNEQNLVGVGGEIVGEDGKTYTYSIRKIVTAKYYSLAGPTYLGFDANETVVTVMPRSIAMGTKLYVKNSTYDFGERVVADEAGGMAENEIYIWISPDHPDYAELIKTVHTDMEIYFID